MKRAFACRIRESGVKNISNSLGSAQIQIELRWRGETEWYPWSPKKVNFNETFRRLKALYCYTISAAVHKQIARMKYANCLSIACAHLDKFQFEYTFDSHLDLSELSLEAH